MDRTAGVQSDETQTESNPAAREDPSTGETPAGEHCKPKVPSLKHACHSETNRKAPYQFVAADINSTFCCSSGRKNKNENEKGIAFFQNCVFVIKITFYKFLCIERTFSKGFLHRNIIAN